MRLASLVLGVFASISTAIVQAAPGVAYPSEPIRFVVPFPAGGSGDALARLFGNHLERMWAQKVLVINKPGGGTVIGVNEVANSKPDGHTIGLIVPSFVTNASLIPQLPYDTVRDLAGVTQLVSLPIALYARTTLPVRTISELVAYAKRQPNDLTYGSAGRGTTSHLAGQMLNQMIGVDMLHVPYKGSIPAQVDLSADRLDLLFDSVAAATPMVRAGRIRMIASAGSRRTPMFPDVPSISETVKGFSVESYFGIVARRGTPPPVLEQIQIAFKTLMKDPQIAAWLDEQGMVPIGSTPAEFDAFIKADMQKWAAVIGSLGAEVK